MPDIHWGYGFCIGGVCATDPEEDGVISPGGVGYDINCGVRLVRTNLHESDVRPVIQNLMGTLFKRTPAGVGTGGPYLFDAKQLRRLMAEGVRYLESQGLATAGDVEHTEAHGCLTEADPAAVSPRAARARRRPVRHARLGQPLPRSSGRRRNLRRRGGSGDGACAGRNLPDDPFRIAWPGLPGLR